MLPLQAFFCSLCCEFSKDIGKAEEHIKSVEHNKKFKASLSLSSELSWEYLQMETCYKIRCCHSDSAFDQAGLWCKN